MRVIGWLNVVLLWTLLIACVSPPPLKPPGEPPLPHADAGRFSVAVADLDGDEHGAMKKTIVQGLMELARNPVLASDTDGQETQGIQVLQLSRMIGVETAGDTEQAVAYGHETARRWLVEMRATMLLWGNVLRLGAERVPVLHVTTWGWGVGGVRYPLGERDLDLPPELRSGLGAVLQLIIAAEFADVEAQQGRYVGVGMWPFLERVTALVGSAAFNAWEPRQRVIVRLRLGEAQCIYGSQQSDNATLDQAIKTIKDALEDVIQTNDPGMMARVYFMLGTAFMIRGERKSDTTGLGQAVVNFRSALKGFESMRDPLNSALTKNNLGSVLAILFDRERNTEKGTRYLQDAVAVLTESIEECTDRCNQLDKARIKSNLGGVLIFLSESDGDTANLHRAISFLSEALREAPRWRAPLDWAQTKNKLGLAFLDLGEREGSGGTENIAKAVIAFGEALEEQTDARDPLARATTQLNMGRALRTLGKRTRRQSLLCEALSVHLSALSTFALVGVPDADRARTALQVDLSALNVRGVMESPCPDLPADRQAWQARPTLSALRLSIIGVGPY